MFKRAPEVPDLREMETQYLADKPGLGPDENTEQAASFEINTADATVDDRYSDGPSQDQPALELDHTFFIALMDNDLPDALYLKDLQSRFMLVNGALARKWYSLNDPAQVIGRTDFDFYTQEHARKAYEDEQRIISTGRPSIGMEERLTWPDGRISWAQTSKFPLRNAAGKTIGTWGISHDITDRKRTEEDLKSSEEKLRHSQKMEAFGQLAGGIAHDFNNMLSVILGAAQLILMEVDPKNTGLKRNADMVIDTTKRAADLTQQLLAFARKGNYTVAALEVHGVIHTVFNLLQHTIDKRIKIIERLSARYNTVMGDYVQLQNALLNLALNARDAMPEGGTLTFSTETIGPGGAVSRDPSEDIEPGSFLRITVTDTGAGMDEKTRLRAFEPFFTTKVPGKGTGLGLASVYGTVKNHNGLIELDSEPGKGTTFTIFLPLALSKAEESKVEVPKAIIKGSAHILIIDDEEDIRTITSEILSKLGYSVVTCKDGIEGTEYYKNHFAEIDVIIVDMLMPRMSGYDCIKYLKRTNPEAKILISSGYSLVSDTQKIISKGIAGFIQKPFQIEELSQTIMMTLAKKG
jgi:PAS domain S-box-containing protein